MINPSRLESVGGVLSRMARTDFALTPILEKKFEKNIFCSEKLILLAYFLKRGTFFPWIFSKKELLLKTSIRAVSASFEGFLLIFWLHFLIINLFVGSWISRDGIKYDISKRLVFLPLISIYLMGPVGLVIYWVVRIFYAKRLGFHD